MSILAILTFLVQLGFAVHVIRTGREMYWIFIIIFIPILGIALYFFTQILPDSRNNYTVRKAGNRLLKAVDPQRELRQRKDELAVADTIENRIRLADECYEAGLYDDAIELLQKSLATTHENDPDMLLKLAQNYYAKAEYPKALEALDTLIQANPDFKSHDGHLLYAKSLEAVDRKDEALKEYAELARSYPGEEGRIRYANLLKARGETTQAQAVYQDVLTRAKNAPKYYRKKEKQWLEIARQNTTG